MKQEILLGDCLYGKKASMERQNSNGLIKKSKKVIIIYGYMYRF